MSLHAKTYNMADGLDDDDEEQVLKEYLTWFLSSWSM